MCAQKSTFETDFAKSGNYPGPTRSLASRGCLDMPFSLHEKGLTYISCFRRERYFPFNLNVPILDVNHLPELTDRRITLLMGQRLALVWLFRYLLLLHNIVIR